MFSFFQYHRSVRAYGNLQFFGDFDISNPFKAVLFAPIGFLYAAFAPFPWQLGSVMQIMAVPETIAFYFLFPKTARGIVFAYKNMFGRSVILLTIIVMTLGFLALVEGNSGTLFRHRAVAFYLIFIFTALGISLKKNEN